MRHRTVPISAALVAVPLGLLTACSDAQPESSTSPAAPALTAELVSDEVTAPREVIAVGDVLLVGDQTGVVHVLEDDTRREEPFLDVGDTVRQPSAGNLELGLAGLVLAPDFEASGTFYTLTTTEPGEDAGNRVRRVDTVTAWTADPETLVADPSSAVVLLEMPQEGDDHVGDLAMDADGALWIGASSPGAAAPAQDSEELPGSLLRIVPGADGSYSTPEDNPFADGGGAAEVFSYGYRNPWRLSLDPELGVVVAEAMSRDAFQHVWVPEPGDDAGYPLVGRETKQCWEDGTAAPACEELDGVQMTPPTLEYGPDFGRIVSGVVVLRDEQYGPLAGTALVADWDGTMLSAKVGDAPWPFTEIQLDPEIPDDRYLWDLSVTDGVAYATTTDRSLGTGEVWRLELAG